MMARRIIAARRRAAGGGSAFLSAYPGAFAAFSLRDLQSSVSAVIRVRRSSDNAEQDFYAADITDGSLTGWVGSGNDGFVRTLYDQSGNGNHLTERTDGDAEIISAGSVNTLNGRPAIKLTRARFVCDVPFSLTAQSVFAVFAYLFSSDRYARVFSNSDSGVDHEGVGHFIPILRDDTDEFCYFASDFEAIINVPMSTQVLFRTIRNTGGVFTAMYKGGQASGLPINASSFTRFSLGDNPQEAPRGALVGSIQELIVYNENKAIEADAVFGEVDAYYGIPG